LRGTNNEKRKRKLNQLHTISIFCLKIIRKMFDNKRGIRHSKRNQADESVKYGQIMKKKTKCRPNTCFDQSECEKVWGLDFKPDGYNLVSRQYHEFDIGLEVNERFHKRKGFNTRVYC